MSADRRRDGAELPPAGLPGLDPRWSRLVEVPTPEGVHTWHVLDNAAELALRGLRPTGTILAVHGNPTWSYLWRTVLRAAGDAAVDGSAWRVIAVDQLEMGYSERTGRARDLAQRVHDLGALTDALALDGPVVTLGHDWGGVVSLGWAVDHPEQLAGVALLNTAVHQPDGAALPEPLRVAMHPMLLRPATAGAPVFSKATLALGNPPLAATVRQAYLAPYRTVERRAGIHGFVADIPFDATRPSWGELQRIAEGVRRIGAPALVLWGPKDPVFRGRYLDDLIGRLPQARVHRFEGAGHLLPEDVDIAHPVIAWAESAIGAGASGGQRDEEPPLHDWRPLGSVLESRSQDDGPALVEMGDRGPARTVPWSLLSRRVGEIAGGLLDLGVQPGDRVSLLVRPGADLVAIAYACLRLGAVLVVADSGLGLAGLGRAVTGSAPKVVIGGADGLTAARALGWPGSRVSTTTLDPVRAAALGVVASVPQLARRGAAIELPPHPSPDDDAAILFTSGSTGPAKGVLYTQRRLTALRDVLADHLGIEEGSGLVAGFAPFALLGPALGCVSVTPRMDVTAPRTLTASAFAAAAEAVGATIAFVSPAALENVVATADRLGEGARAALAGIEVLLSAGAPVGAPLLRAAQRLLPEAVPHTPYGMTEGLLLTDITLAGIEAAGEGEGVCVGRPVGQVRVRIAPLAHDGAADGALTERAGTTGEIVVSAAHVKERYDRLWLTQRESARDDAEGRRWHRTGDVGRLDEAGRLWIEGRLPHVVTTIDGPITPVGPEQRAQRVEGVRRAAFVGAGPAGAQVPVIVLEASERSRPGLAPDALAERVRAAVDLPLAAVLLAKRLPTDIRHNSKIDRRAVAVWAERVLRGERPGAL